MADADSVNPAFFRCLYRRSPGYRRISRRGPIDWGTLLALGPVDRGWFKDRDGRDVPRVHVQAVLCPSCREYHAPAGENECMALPRKSESANGSASSSLNVLASGMLSGFSELWAFLTATHYPDGSKRQTGRLSLSCDGDMLGLLLTDDETGQYAALNGRSLDDLILEAEARLADGTLQFRPSRYRSNRSRK